MADLRAVVALSRQGSIPVQIARCHFDLATLLVSTGAWDDALLHARIGLALASDEGQPSMQSQCHAVLATVKACRGEWAMAESEIVAATEAANLRGNIEATATALIAAATLADVRQDPARVISLLHTLPRTVPMLARLAFWPALISALIDDSQLDRAEHQITELVRAAAARRLDMEARVLGLRARLAAAGQGPDDALGLFDAALGGYGPDDPFLERTALLYAYGRTLLTRGQRERAIAVLREARDAFATLAAGPFLERVDVDLASAGVDQGEENARAVEVATRPHRS